MDLKESIETTSNNGFSIGDEPNQSQNDQDSNSIQEKLSSTGFSSGNIPTEAIQVQNDADSILSNQNESFLEGENEETYNNTNHLSQPKKAGVNDFNTKPLTVEMIAQGISLLARTGNGNSHAYTRLELHNLNITSIDVLETFCHLRYLNLSNNSIQNIDVLAPLEYLLSVDLSNNHLHNIPNVLDRRKYLQQANFSKNRITSMNVSNWHLLTWLNLNGKNRLKELCLHAFPSLVHLECRSNLLANNQIEKLGELENLIHLQLLHLRDNKLEVLDNLCEELKELSYLNLRNNLISSLNEIDKLNVLPNLKSLVLLQNPLENIPNYRLEVIMRLPRLEKLDKEGISEEEREEAIQLKLQLAVSKEKEDEAKGDDKDDSSDTYKKGNEDEEADE
ncbi:Leucine-rich repeat-containing protein 23 [Clydaea vesicula]|uniref:Leucine-rich repeat-containing protein 23 n=1 Tax=Clydaea vesicula TaxID=447962 RepID=A0AAD5U926_9FUNG|nr:Leucine-rich repeat-containing protein 23 [Clydaea vesicula]